MWFRVVRKVLVDVYWFVVNAWWTLKILAAIAAMRALDLLTDRDE